MSMATRLVEITVKKETKHLIELGARIEGSTEEAFVDHAVQYYLLQNEERISQGIKDCQEVLRLLH